MNLEQFLNTAGTITLCGSTRFFEAYTAANRLLTLKGWTVLSCGQFGHSYHKEVCAGTTVEKIKALHFHKILESDAICIVNGNQYMGKSTTLEVAFAAEHGKSIIEFEATSLHCGEFKAVDIVSKRKKSTLDTFLQSPEWEEFIEHNPDFY